MSKNQKIKKVDEYEEQRNVRLLEQKIRDTKEKYIDQRDRYFNELERAMSCSYTQCRIMTDTEREMLSYLYKKYLDTYCEYLKLKEQCSNYIKTLNWLRCI